MKQIFTTPKQNMFSIDSTVRFLPHTYALGHLSRFFLIFTVCFQPKMHISDYHYPLDIPKIISSLSDILSRKLFLRHQHSTLYDTNIIVV